jgi:hypothetical protein
MAAKLPRGGKCMSRREYLAYRGRQKSAERASEKRGDYVRPVDRLMPARKAETAGRRVRSATSNKKMTRLMRVRPRTKHSVKGVMGQPRKLKIVASIVSASNTAVGSICTAQEKSDKKMRCGESEYTMTIAVIPKRWTLYKTKSCKNVEI